MHLLHVSAHSALFLDVRDIASRLGHQLHSVCLANNPWLARGGQDPDLTCTFAWNSPGPETCERFRHRYSAALTCFDAFVVDHPIWFAALFEGIGKPVVANATTRYDLAVAGKPALCRWLNDTLQRMFDRGQLSPVSNNRADAAYSRDSVGFDWPTTPSLCEYTRISYTGVRSEWLLSTLAAPALPRPYVWSDLGLYRGIRHVPYNTSQMRITEQYAAGIPLAVPSPQNLLRMAIDGAFEAMSQVSALRHEGYPPANGWNAYTSPEALARWIELSDWYDEEWMPHVLALEDVMDTSVLHAIDAPAVSARVVQFNAARRRRILGRWQSTLAEAAERHPNSAAVN